MPRALAARIDELVSAGAASSRSEFIRQGVELAVQAHDPRVKSTVAALLINMMGTLAPALETVFEEMSPDLIKELQALDATLMVDYFSKVFGVSTHTKKALDKKIQEAKRQGRKKEKNVA